MTAITTLLEGTLMYVTDELTIISYTGVDSEIAKINEKGYYYFDGIEWVKTS